jgi:hypothetical protein
LPTLIRKHYHVGYDDEVDESLRDGEDDKTLLERLKRENAELEGQNNLLEVKNQAIIHNVCVSC